MQFSYNPTTNYCPYCGRNCNCNTTNYGFTNYYIPIKVKKDFLPLYNNSLKHLQAMTDAIYFYSLDHKRKIITYSKNILKWYFKNSGSFRYSYINPSRNFHKEK